MKWLRVLAASVVLGCSCGCASMIVRVVDPEFGDQVYPATCLDAAGVAYLTDDLYNKGDEWHGLVLLPLIDLPFSLVTDTVLLPVDLACMACK